VASSAGAAVDVDVFDRHHLRRAVIRRMRVVPALDVLRADRRGVRRGRRQGDEGHVALLAEQADHALRFRRRHERTLRDLLGQQLAGKALAHFLVESGRGQALRCQRLQVAVLVELAVVALEGGNAHDRAAHLRVAHGDPLARGGHLQHVLVDQLVEDGALVVDALECARIEVVALLLARQAAGTLERATEFIRLDGVCLPQHRDRPRRRRRRPPRRRRLQSGDERVVVLGHVLVDAEEGERHRQPGQQDGRDPAGRLFAECLQHRMPCAACGISRAVYPQCGNCAAAAGKAKSPHRCGLFAWIDGGVDGTRTRDLRRDRPAF